MCGYWVSAWPMIQNLDFGRVNSAWIQRQRNRFCHSLQELNRNQVGPLSWLATRDADCQRHCQSCSSQVQDGRLIEEGVLWNLQILPTIDPWPYLNGDRYRTWSYGHDWETRNRRALYLKQHFGTTQVAGASTDEPLCFHQATLLSNSQYLMEILKFWMALAGGTCVCLVRGKRSLGKRSRCHPSGWCATKSIEGRTVRWQNWQKHTYQTSTRWAGLVKLAGEQQSTWPLWFFLHQWRLPRAVAGFPWVLTAPGGVLENKLFDLDKYLPLSSVRCHSSFSWLSCHPSLI